MEWRIPAELKPGTYAPNELVECKTRDLAVVLYEIEEERMMTEYARVALVENKAAPRVALRSIQLKSFVRKSQTVYLDKQERYLFLAREIHHEGKSDAPFVILDLSTHAFTFFPMQNSLHYLVEEADGRPTLKRCTADPRFPNREGETIDLRGAIWHPAEALDQMPGLYFA